MKQRERDRRRESESARERRERESAREKELREATGEREESMRFGGELESESKKFERDNLIFEKRRDLCNKRVMLGF